MKANLVDLTGKKVKEIELPSQFDSDYRPDLIKRAVLAIQSHLRQAYGSKEGAGMRHSAELSRRRRKYRGSYGHGISRVPRKIMTRRGTQFNWTGALAPGTVGGRRAHPPKAEKKYAQKINITERRYAIRSAIAATVDKKLVAKRGHAVPDIYPFVIDAKFEAVKKTAEAKKVLSALGLDKELERASIKKVRAGKGKNRSRRYKKRTGPLIIVSKKCDLNKSLLNVPGIDIITVDSINTELLAPGTTPGRLTLWTQNAIEKLDKEKLFTNVKVPHAKIEDKK